MTTTGDPVAVTVYTTAGRAETWVTPVAALPFDATAGSPWLLVPPAVRAGFDAMTAAGTPLAETAFGAPRLGVKCGCNVAFIVALDPDADPVGSSGPSASGDSPVAIRSVVTPTAAVPARRGWVERALLRPVARGQTLDRWVWNARPPTTARAPRVRTAEWIIWTHEDPTLGTEGPRTRLPPLAARWLAHWRHRLAARSDTRGELPWWTLFRTESAGSAYPRVVWADLGRSPRAAVLPPHDATVPLNSCYVARAPDLSDALALAALLNSAPAAAWLNVLAEPARGNYRRYMGWTVALLPLPRGWASARAVLASLAAAAIAGTPPPESHLTAAVAAAYGLDVAALHPLLAWGGS